MHGAFEQSRHSAARPVELQTWGAALHASFLHLVGGTFLVKGWCTIFIGIFRYVFGAFLVEGGLGSHYLLIYVGALDFNGYALFYSFGRVLLVYFGTASGDGVFPNRG